MPDAPLTLTERQHGSWVVVEVVGDLDLATAPNLVEAIPSQQPGGTVRIAFDLAGVRFIDSSGLRAMLQVRRDDAADLVLVAPSSAVTELLAITRLADAFTIVPSVEKLALP